jgi:hypothetical protein
LVIDTENAKYRLRSKVMTDLIKREDAIKAVVEPFDRKYWNYTTRSIRDTVKILKDIPSAENKGEWIPCSERLPEAGVSVIVTSKGGYVYTSNIAHGEWEYGGDVIAWMPLPKPWEGADNE